MEDEVSLFILSSLPESCLMGFRDLDEVSLLSVHDCKLGPHADGIGDGIEPLKDSTHKIWGNHL